MLLDDAAPARPAFRDTNVVRWLGAYASSVTGDLVYFLALSWVAAHGAGPAQAGVVLAVGAVPRAVLMLAGGVIADRLGPRRVLIGSDLVRCTVAVAVAVLTFLAGFELWALVGLALVFGVVDAMFMPAVGALPPRIAARSQLTRVQALRTLAVRVANTIGPLIAASVLAAAGSSGAFTTAGLLFITSVVLLLTVHLTPVPPTELNEPRQPRTPWADLRDGLRYLRGDRRLSRLVVVIALSEMCFSGPVAAGLVLLANERHWSPAVAGWILSAFSVGGAGIGILLTALKRLPRAATVMTSSLALTAVLVAAVGNVATPGPAVALGAMLGITSGAVMIVSNGLLQKQARPGYLGRITSVTTLCTVGLSPLIYPLVGLVTAAWGTFTFFAACGVVCLLATTASLSPALRPG